MKKFQSTIRSLNTRNPREFWNMLKSETNYKSMEFTSAVFANFTEHFRELNSDPLFSCTAPPCYEPALVPTNDVINQPFTVDEIKSSIKKLKKQQIQWRRSYY